MHTDLLNPRPENYLYSVPYIMTIRIYNTLSGKREPLKPLEPGHVKLYVCGITSYDYCHIGHARSALAFDMIVRYLRYLGNKVTYIRNFTDILIDQKISIKKYITLSVRAFLTGEYTYIKNGKKLNGRKKEGIMRKVKIENRVIKALTDEYPEYFL